MSEFQSDIKDRKYDDEGPAEISYSGNIQI